MTFDGIFGAGTEPEILPNNGKKIYSNNDSYYANGYIGLFIIADGVGVMGEKPSSTIVSYVSRDLEDIIQEQPALLENEDKFKHKLKDILINANNYVIKETKKKFANHNNTIGTTLDLVVISENKAYAAHIGDSRISLLKKDSSIEDWMRDEKKSVLESIEDGEMEFPPEKKRWKKKALDMAIKRSKSLDEKCLDNLNLNKEDIAIDCINLEDIDSIIMYTDGLDNLSKSTIKDILVNNNPQESVNKLILSAKNDPDSRLVKVYADTYGTSLENAKMRVSGKDDMTAIVIKTNYKEIDLNYELSEPKKLINDPSIKLESLKESFSGQKQEGEDHSILIKFYNKVCTIREIIKKTELKVRKEFSGYISKKYAEKQEQALKEKLSNQENKYRDQLSQEKKAYKLELETVTKQSIEEAVKDMYSQKQLEEKTKEALLKQKKEHDTKLSDLVRLHQEDIIKLKKKYKEQYELRSEEHTSELHSH